MQHSNESQPHSTKNIEASVVYVDLNPRWQQIFHGSPHEKCGIMREGKSPKYFVKTLR